MEDRSQQVLAVGCTFFVLSWTAVMLRVYVRVVLIKSWGSDDWAMAAALLAFTGYLICQLGGVHYGTGRLDAALTPGNKEKALRFWFFCEVFYAFAATALKIAVGLFLLRIAVRRRHIYTIYFIHTASIVFGFAYLCVFVFQCKPVETFWTIHPNNSHCMPKDIVAGFTYGASALGSIADWVFGTLPAFIVWDLQMNGRTKCVVVAILGFAAIGSTATLVRIPYIKGMKAESNFLYTTTDCAIWSTVEPGIGITAACIATLRPMLQAILHRTGLTTHSRTPTHDYAANWSSGNHLASKGRSGYIRSNSYSHGLNKLRPDGSGTTTTVTGAGDKNWRDDSDGGSEEHIIASTRVNMAGNIQISKSVQITHIQETRMPSDNADGRRSDDSFV